MILGGEGKDVDNTSGNEYDKKARSRNEGMGTVPMNTLAEHERQILGKGMDPIGKQGHVTKTTR